MTAPTYFYREKELRSAELLFSTIDKISFYDAYFWVESGFLPMAKSSHSLS